MQRIMLSLLIIPLSALSLWLWRRLYVQPAKLNVPWVKFEGDNSPARYMTEYASIIAEGYAKYTSKGQPFCMRHPQDPKRPFIILPLKYLDEVKWAAENRLSLWTFIDKRSVLPEIGGPRITDQVVLAVKVGLNRALGYLMPRLQDKCLSTFKTAMSACQDWTSLHPYPVIVQVVSSMVASTVIGPERGEISAEWEQLSMQYLESALKAPTSVTGKYHPWLYWISRYLDENVKTMWSIRRRVSELLRPSLNARITATDGQSAKKKGQREYEDCIQWLLDAYRSKGQKLVPDQLAQDLFIIVVASIHGISGTALALLFDLMEHPESVKEIQEEIARVKSKNPVWTRQALAELRILDSFMWESGRVHALTQLTAMQRMPLQPYTFKDGFTLPAGVTIAFPSFHAGLDETIHENPETFDARRQLRKRENCDSHKFVFASASGGMLSWGVGRHACPGRFFAQETLKLVFIHLLSHYEFKHSEETQNGPLYISHELFHMPNPARPIWVKEKSTL